MNEDKVKRCIFYIHIFFDSLPALEYSMRNRTEQNRTEQNSVDVLGLGVKPYFEHFYPLQSERISHRATNQFNNPWATQYLSSAYCKEV